MTEILGNPTIQYGFAGICLVLLGMLGWLMRQQAKDSGETRNQLVAVVKDSNRVVEANTTAIQVLSEKSKEERSLLTDVRDRLLKHRCMADPPDRSGKPKAESG